MWSTLRLFRERDGFTGLNAVAREVQLTELKSTPYFPKWSSPDDAERVLLGVAGFAPARRC